MLINIIGILNQISWTNSHTVHDLGTHHLQRAVLLTGSQQHACMHEPTAPLTSEPMLFPVCTVPEQMPACPLQHPLPFADQSADLAAHLRGRLQRQGAAALL